MMEKKQNKYRIEKALHELIRDIPEIRCMADKYEHGYLMIEDALEEIAYVIKQERNKL